MVWCSLCVCLREQFYDMSSNVAYGQTWETLNWISWLQSQIVSQRRGARALKILWYFPTFSSVYCRSALKQNRSVLTKILGDIHGEKERGESDLNGHNLPSFTHSASSNGNIVVAHSPLTSSNIDHHCSVSHAGAAGREKDRISNASINAYSIS